MIFSLQQCERFNIEPTEILTMHFILTRNATERIDGFSSFEFTSPRGESWYLSHGHLIDRASACSPQGDVFVLFLGLAVDKEGRIVNNETLALLLAKHSNIEAIAEELSYAAGRYNFFIFSSDTERGYCDPNGLLGFVYNNMTKTVASALTLCFEGELVPEDEYPSDYREAFGYTRDKRVKRLCPNHFLDMNSLGETRHWPKDALELVDAGDEDAFLDKTTKFAERHKQVIRSLVRHSSHSILPLTGGQDSRILLACAKDSLDDVDMLYTHMHNWASREDALAAELLANSQNRELVTYDVNKDDNIGDEKSAIDDVFVRHMIASGSNPSFDVPEESGQKLETWRLKCEYFPPEGGGILMRGHVTDLSKAVLYYRAARRVSRGKKIQNFTALNRMMIAPENSMDAATHPPIILKEYNEWIAGMRKGMQERLIDFVGIEQYRPYTLSAYFLQGFRTFYICPGNDRRCIELAASLPPLDRANLKMNKLITQSTAPEVDHVPFRPELKSWTAEQKDILRKSVENARTTSQAAAVPQRIEALQPIRTPLRPVRKGRQTIWLKDETSQLGGAFKLRGPSEFLDRHGVKGQVVTSASSGNHAIGLSTACLARGLKVQIFVPDATPEAKLVKIKDAGGNITKVNGDYEAALATAMSYAERKGALFVPSYDHPDVVTGNARIFEEICAELERPPAKVYVPVGGGGILSGALRYFANTGTEIIGVEMVEVSRVHAIVFSGETEVPPPSVALPPSTEGISIRTIGKYPSELIRSANNLTIEQVSVAELQEAGRLIWNKLGIRAELGACAGFAAAMRASEWSGSKHPCVSVITGGNIADEDHKCHVLMERSK